MVTSQACPLAKSANVGLTSHETLEQRLTWKIKCESHHTGQIYLIQLANVTEHLLWHRVLKEINPEYSLEGLMLKLKLQFWSSDGKSWLIGKDPDARKDWRQKKRAAEDEMVGWHHRLSGHEFKSKLQKIVEDRGTWHTAIHGVTKSQTSLSDWTNDDSNYDICQLHIRVCVCVMHNYCAFGIQGKLRKKQTWSENHFMQPLLTRILNVHVTWVY